ncbi:MAG: hypothetical protein Q4C36_00185 [Coriobacteriia bacterium]|nr:hypothetical protein [Coriobacteriia bacterium]
MEERELDKTLEQLFQQDLSAGTEEFRDELLARCLAVLDAENGVGEIDDGLLGMLTAAGDVYSAQAEADSSVKLQGRGPRA